MAPGKERRPGQGTPRQSSSSQNRPRRADQDYDATPFPTGPKGLDDYADREFGQQNGSKYNRYAQNETIRRPSLPNVHSRWAPDRTPGGKTVGIPAKPSQMGMAPPDLPENIRVPISADLPDRLKQIVNQCRRLEWLSSIQLLASIVMVVFAVITGITYAIVQPSQHPHTTQGWYDFVAFCCTLTISGALWVVLYPARIPLVVQNVRFLKATWPQLIRLAPDLERSRNIDLFFRDVRRSLIDSSDLKAVGAIKWQAIRILEFEYHEKVGFPTFWKHRNKKI